MEVKMEVTMIETKKGNGFKIVVDGKWLYVSKKAFYKAISEKHGCIFREFIEETGKVLGMNIVWKGKGLKEKGIDKKTGKTVIEIDPKYFRPAEVDVLQGDYSKAKKKLGWKPKIGFKELVRLMAESDLEKEHHARD